GVGRRARLAGAPACGVDLARVCAWNAAFWVESSSTCRGALMTSRPAQSHMLAALAEAEAAGGRGEVPVGAVVVGADGRVLGRAGNRTRELADPTAHAEILAVRQACAAQGSERLDAADIYVTLE